MPNNVSNKLTVYGNAHTLQRIMEFMRSDDGKSAFDFEKLIPRPAELDDICVGATTIDGKKYRQWRETPDPQAPYGKRMIGIGPEEEAELVAKYGHANVIDWSYANWGTKWNAYSGPTARMGKAVLYFEFDTAWDTPKPVIQALSDRFGVTVRVRVGGEVDQKYTYQVTPQSDYSGE